MVGGSTREAPPTPLLLRSGDAVVLAGQARRCFHGVPRIFPLTRGGKVRRPQGVALYEEEEVDWGEGGPEFAAIAEYMGGCRVNVSVRATAEAGV